ncbi:MAG: hypothetical protein J6Y70_01170 [Bacilli bacterium]|nr:hypothetical protein [Bacilli bacterium]
MNCKIRSLILSSIFISLSVIVGYYSKYLFLGYFSLKHAFLIFSSIILGPLYGAIIWSMNDILSNLFFNYVGIFWFDLNFFYMIEGSFPGVCLLMLNFIDKNKKHRLLFLIFLIFISGYFIIFLLINSSIEEIHLFYFRILLNEKIIISFITLICISYIGIIFLLNLFFKKWGILAGTIDIYSVAIIVLLNFIIFELIFFSLIFALHQEISFKIFLLKRVIFAIKHIFLDTFFVSLLISAANKNLYQTNSL